MRQFDGGGAWGGDGRRDMPLQVIVLDARRQVIVPDAGRWVIGIDADGRTSPGGSTVLANGTALPAGVTRAAAPDRHAPSFDAGRHLQDRRKARPADLSQPRARDKRKPGPGQPLQGVENRRTSRWAREGRMRQKGGELPFAGVQGHLDARRQEKISTVGAANRGGRRVACLSTLSNSGHP